MSVCFIWSTDFWPWNWTCILGSASWDFKLEVKLYECVIDISTLELKESKYFSIYSHTNISSNFLSFSLYISLPISLYLLFSHLTFLHSFSYFFGDPWPIQSWFKNLPLNVVIKKEGRCGGGEVQVDGWVKEVKGREWTYALSEARGWDGVKNSWRGDWEGGPHLEYI